MNQADELIDAACFGARRTRESLGRALVQLQDDPQGKPLTWLTLGMAQTIGRLFAIELGGENHIRTCMADAVERLRELLGNLQQLKGSNTAAHEATSEIASALTALHPLYAALEKARRGKKVLMLMPEPEEEASEPAVASGADTDRRDSARTKLDVEVGFNTDTNFYEGRSGDLSDGGVFVVTTEPLPVGEEVQLSMLLPTGQQITLPGRVQWARAGGRISGMPPGMGIRFLEAGEDAMQGIRDFAKRREPIRR